MEQQEKQEQAKNDTRRRTALLRYIGIMFAVAFVLVAGSLFLQMRNSQTTISQLNETNSSALSKAEELQNENRMLQDKLDEQIRENQAIQKELDEEKALIDKMLTDTESEQQKLEQAHRDELETLQTEYDRTEQAYEALLVAMTSDRAEGNVTYSKAMETLKQVNSYLSETGKAEYEKLLTK